MINPIALSEYKKLECCLELLCQINWCGMKFLSLLPLGVGLGKCGEKSGQGCARSMAGRMSETGGYTGH